MVAGIRKRVTKRGEVMLLLDVEDLSGASVETIVFPRVQEQFGEVVRPDAKVLVKGRVDRDARDDTVKLVALEVREPNLGDDRPLQIKLAGSTCTQRLVSSLKEILANHPGSTHVFLHLEEGESTTVLRLGSEFSVDARNGLYAELKAVLGPHALISA